jgi:hypothetical protein
MHNQKLHEQKIQVEFDTYKLQLDTLKAKISSASADAQIEIKKQIKELEKKITKPKAILAKKEERMYDE